MRWVPRLGGRRSSVWLSPLDSQVGRNAPDHIEEKPHRVGDDQGCVLALVLCHHPLAVHKGDVIGVEGHVQPNHEQDDEELHRAHIYQSMLEQKPSSACQSKSSSNTLLKTQRGTPHDGCEASD